MYKSQWVMDVVVNSNSDSIAIEDITECRRRLILPDNVLDHLDEGSRQAILEMGKRCGNPLE